MKRIFSIILAVTLLSMSLVSLASAEQFDPKSICEGVTLTVAVAENTRIADWNENEMTQYIEEALGVNLEFEVYPKADFFSKINAMVMAGDELPDLVIFPAADNTTYLNWASEGALLELSKYYEDPNLAANITAACEGAGYDIESYMKNGDGEIYALPKIEQGLGMESRQRFWIYQPWLDAMGVDVPTNIDEYYDICKYVIANDMNGNGDATDEYALMGNGFNNDDNWGDWFEPLMSAFVYAWDPNFAVVEDGQVSFAYTSDAWKDGLKYIKKFFDEGLIGTSLFTNTTDDGKANLYADGPLCLSFSGWQWEGPDLQVKNNYTYIDGMKGPEGQAGYSQYMPILPSATAVISADTKNPEAAFLVCDLMCSEYLSLTTRYGEEGVNWAYWDRVLAEDVLNPDEYAAQGGDAYQIEWISSYADTTFWSSTDTQNISWLQAGPYIRTAALQAVRARQITAATEEELLKISNTNIDLESKFAGIANAPAEVMDYYPLTAEQTETAKEIQITLNNYVSEMTAAFLTGKKDIDGEWDNYLAQLNIIGLDTLQEIYQGAYSLVH